MNGVYRLWQPRAVCSKGGGANAMAFLFMLGYLGRDAWMVFQPKGDVNRRTLVFDSYVQRTFFICQLGCMVSAVSHGYAGNMLVVHHDRGCSKEEIYNERRIGDVTVYRVCVRGSRVKVQVLIGPNGNFICAPQCRDGLPLETGSKCRKV